MKATVKLKLIQKLGIELILSKKNGNTYKKQVVVFKDLDDQYAKEVAVEFFGDKFELIENVQVGSVCEMHCDIVSTEYNGRWYTKVSAWKLDVLGAVGPAPIAAAMPQSTTAASTEVEDDLPF